MPFFSVKSIVRPSSDDLPGVGEDVDDLAVGRRLDETLEDHRHDRDVGVVGDVDRIEQRGSEANRARSVVGASSVGRRRRVAPPVPSGTVPSARRPAVSPVAQPSSSACRRRRHRRSASSKPVTASAARPSRCGHCNPPLRYAAGGQPEVLPARLQLYAMRYSITCEETDCKSDGLPRGGPTA